jgi:xanthine dehydrogenase YagS FAD-binding subunit
MRNFEYLPAPDVERAVELLSAGTADAAERPRFIAGGTDLLHEMKEGLSHPARLVSLKTNGDLRRIRYDGREGLRVGALVTLADLESHGETRRNYPGVAAALGTIASQQIRNMATVAGNLCQRPRCWYFRDRALHCARKGGMECFAMDGENAYHAILGAQGCVVVHPSDLAPMLIAHDARITYAGPEGRRTMALEEFFVGPEVDITRETVLAPNEIVEEITLPAPAAGTHGVYLKVRDRRTFDFATVSVAAMLQMDGGVCRRGRIVLGGVAPVPWPVPEADALLAGARITPDLTRRVAEAALRGASPLAENGYKVPLARNLVRRAVSQAARTV